MSQLIHSDPNMVPVRQQQEAAVQIASSRQAQEVQAAIVMARRFPRNYVEARNRVLAACTRRKLAEQAAYEYSKGGLEITGPSIRLAETLAQCWGNVDFGIIELEQRDGESTVMSYCWDLETNCRQTKVFQVAHEIKSHKSIKRLWDPREIYELVANQGARRLRACILGIIPGDVVDEALEACDKTLESQTGGKPLAERARELVAAFADLGVSENDIQVRLGHNLQSLTERELIGLGKIFCSVRDGMSKKEDWFSALRAQPGQVAHEFPSVPPVPKAAVPLGQPEPVSAPAPAPAPAAAPTPAPTPAPAAPAPASAGPWYSPLLGDPVTLPILKVFLDEHRALKMHNLDTPMDTWRNRLLSDVTKARSTIMGWWDSTGKELYDADGGEKLP